MVASFALPSPRVLAAAKFPPLQAGMAFHEVVYLWGSPAEKSERETKREDLWRYPQGEVLFREGVVVSWKAQMLSTELLEAKMRPVTPPKRNSLESEQFDELLNEIMRELPDEPAGPGSGNSATTPPGPSNPAAVAGLAPPPLEED